MDIPLAKGYLKSTGGWEKDEIKSFDDKETAIRILWLLCGDAKEGLDILSIGDAERFEEACDVDESMANQHKLILGDIIWPDDVDDMNLPSRDKMKVEIRDGDTIEDVVGEIYKDSYGFAPVSFRVLRDTCLSKFDLGEDDENEMVSQTDLDEMKKKNPKLKDISEER